MRQCIDEHGVMPNQRSWIGAGLSPSEKTIRNRFGSFKAAADAALAGEGCQLKLSSADEP